MNKIREHINMSDKVILCKECNALMMVSYFDNILCKKCDAKYIKIINDK